MLTNQWITIGIFWTTGLIAWSHSHTYAQEPSELTLNQCLILAGNKSTEARQINLEKEMARLRWLNFKADLKPKWNLNGTLPDFSRTFSPTVQPDGTTAFNAVLLSNSHLNSEIVQKVPATGGQVFLQTRLRRFDDFNKNSTAYSGNPFIIGIRQPLYGFNNLRWDTRIQKAVFEESKLTYLKSALEINILVVKRYFDLWQQQIRLEILEKNLLARQRILSTVSDRYTNGKLLEIDLIQAQIDYLNTELEHEQVSSDLRRAGHALTELINTPVPLATRLIAPKLDSSLRVNEEEAVEEAIQNSVTWKKWERQLVELERDLDQTKRSSGVNIDFSATLGFTNRSASLEDIFRNPDDQQTFRLSFTIPIWQWNKRKRAIQITSHQKQLVLLKIEQEKRIFEREVRNEIARFNQQLRKMKSVNLKQHLTMKAFDIAMIKYEAGKGSRFELNQSWENLQNAQNDYIQTIQNYWQSYYQLQAYRLNIH